MPDQRSPAEVASERALAEMRGCLDGGRSFRLEAGAGAGKTYSLVKALQYLIERQGPALRRRRQQIACITFTNVAKDEIIARTDRSPVVFCETNHAFCWSLIKGFQKQLRQRIEGLEEWEARLAETDGGIGDRAVEYALGHRSIKEQVISLHHADVLSLMVSLMEEPKFRRIVAARHPIILVDEYQDTDKDWIQAVKQQFLEEDGAPLFGFFGDHWQKIYGNGCGRLDHPRVTEIGKGANFRSASAIVECLNRMRPELEQFVDDPEAEGSVVVYHTNGVPGPRRTEAHWKGDLPEETARAAFDYVRRELLDSGWSMSAADTKILMLTHRLLASEQGYASLPGAFRDNEAFAKKEHDHIAFFVDQLEPACEAYAARRYGAMFNALGMHARHIDDKTAWRDAMQRLMELRERGTVGDVVEHLQRERRPRLPEAVEKLERQLRDFDPNDEAERPRRLEELERLHAVHYSEIIALRGYLLGHSPFETKHGVKGAEFDNVFAIFGRGWNQYNFNEMLELAGREEVPAARAAMFERNRNLFYVACSRPRRRLALLFTQELSPQAIATLERWFGAENIHAVALDEG